jgi:hypothetical protein
VSLNPYVSTAKITRAMLPDRVPAWQNLNLALRFVDKTTCINKHINNSINALFSHQLHRTAVIFLLLIH